MAAGASRCWAPLLIWGSLSALLVGILNSIRFTFMPTTLWALASHIVLMAVGGGLMVRSLNGYGESDVPF